MKKIRDLTGFEPVLEVFPFKLKAVPHIQKNCCLAS